MSNMNFFINNSCTKCSSCKLICSDKAITKIDGHYVINNDKCTKCGKCKNNCPMKAIELNPLV